MREEESQRGREGRRGRDREVWMRKMEGKEMRETVGRRGGT